MERQRGRTDTLWMLGQTDTKVDSGGQPGNGTRCDLHFAAMFLPFLGQPTWEQCGEEPGQGRGAGRPHRAQWGPGDQ